MTHALASKWLGVSERMDFDNSQPAFPRAGAAAARAERAHHDAGIDSFLIRGPKRLPLQRAA